MEKRRVRRLTLHRETVRTLTDAVLRRVPGGWVCTEIDTTCASCQWWCHTNQCATADC